MTSVRIPDTLPFIEGQRVRVKDYLVGDPKNTSITHFIVGHFGHIHDYDGTYFIVRVSRGPDGGPVSQRAKDYSPAPTPDDWDLWPMLAAELEAVD